MGFFKPSKIFCITSDHYGLSICLEWLLHLRCDVSVLLGNPLLNSLKMFSFKTSVLLCPYVFFLCYPLSYDLFFPNSGTSLYLPHWPSVFFFTFRINWAFCSAAVSAKIEVPSMGFPLPQLLDSGRCKRWTFRHGHFVGLLPPDFKESKSPHRLWEQDTYNNHEPQK